MTVCDTARYLPELETRRLRIRPLRIEDVDDLLAYATDPELMRYSSWETHTSIEDSYAYLQRAVAAYGAGELAPWGIELRSEERLIGTCGFVYWEPENASAEISACLARPYWNQGFMTEAAQAVIDYGFDVMGLNRIQGRVEPRNHASARVMEKAGMVYEGTLRQVVFRERYYDLRMYALLRQDRCERHPDRAAPPRSLLLPALW